LLAGHRLARGVLTELAPGAAEAASGALHAPGGIPGGRRLAAGAGKRLGHLLRLPLQLALLAGQLVCRGAVRLLAGLACDLALLGHHPLELLERLLQPAAERALIARDLPPAQDLRDLLQVASQGARCRSGGGEGVVLQTALRLRLALRDS